MLPRSRPAGYTTTVAYSLSCRVARGLGAASDGLRRLAVTGQQRHRGRTPRRLPRGVPPFPPLYTSVHSRERPCASCVLMLNIFTLRRREGCLLATDSRCVKVPATCLLLLFFACSPCRRYLEGTPHCTLALYALLQVISSASSTPEIAAPRRMHFSTTLMCTASSTSYHISIMDDDTCH
jgi:hypothetical protein